nr:hypothetical protein GCM10020093_096160 [Planobispora longispora]
MRAAPARLVGRADRDRRGPARHAPAHRRRRLAIRLDEFLARTREFGTRRAPAYRSYLKRRDALVAAERERLRLEEYRPKVMSAFVRNQLLDEVYLPSSATTWPSSWARPARPSGPTRWACCCSSHRPATARRR